MLQTIPSPTDVNSKNKSDWTAFHRTITQRRSVRVFSQVPVPESVVQNSLDAALLAPSASNLQPWEFYWVRSPEKKKRLREYCLNQPAANTAAELIVCVARYNIWKKRRDWFVDFYDKLGLTLPKPFDIYYQKIVPATYVIGPFGIVGLLKRLIFAGVRLVRPFSAAPSSRGDLILSATKNTALACQNLMLALRAQGYDSCPMDGFDPWRTAKLLELSRGSKIVMVVAVGARAPEDAAYGPQVRCARSEMVHEV